MEVEDQEQCSFSMGCGGEQRWTARDRTVVARMEQYLNESDSMKVEIEELEHCLLGSEVSEVDLRHIVMKCKKRRRLFRSSVRRVRVSSWLSVWRDGTSFLCVQGGGVPRAQQGHQTYEQKAREAIGNDGTKQTFDERSAGGSSKTDIPRSQRLGQEDLWMGD